MALSQTITRILPLVGSMQFNAHCRVTSISGGKNGMSVACELRVSNGSGELIDVLHSSFIPSLDGDNFIRQAYMHLKTLPEFSGATDC